MLGIVAPLSTNLNFTVGESSFKLPPISDIVIFTASVYKVSTM